MVQRMMRTLVALAVAAAILVPTISVSATDLDSGFEWTLQDPGRRASAIEADIPVRPRVQSVHDCRVLGT
jgi:hypothetical protein